MNDGPKSIRHSSRWAASVTAIDSCQNRFVRQSKIDNDQVILRAYVGGLVMLFERSAARTAIGNNRSFVARARFNSLWLFREDQDGDFGC